MKNAREMAIHTDSNREKRIQTTIDAAAKSGLYQTTIPLKWVDKAEYQSLKDAGYAIMAREDDQSIIISWDPRDINSIKENVV